MLSASARAMLVSSVHSPGASPYGPPLRKPVTGAKVPGSSNSIAAPSASPIASPNKVPRHRSMVVMQAIVASSQKAGERGASAPPLAAVREDFLHGPPRDLHIPAGMHLV